MNDISAALKQELAQLQAELERDPRYEKIQKIRALLEVYEPVRVRTSPFGKAAAPANHPAAGDEEDGSKAAKVRAEINALLSKNGTTHRQTILAHLIGKKLMGHEKKPIRSLASYLSRWDEFISDGQGNFFLAPKSRT